jgi:hypothetical protein
MAELAMSTPALKMWVIYRYPKDFLNRWVVREWTIDRTLTPGGARFAESLEQARAHVPPGKSILSRSEDDDPAIVETWL